MKVKQNILDVCCGSRMFWFDKNNKNVIFVDIRSENHVLCDNRKLSIDPDIIADFRELPFDDDQFDLVVFDPPHLEKLGVDSWMAKKYGVLFPTWENDIRDGFSECFRVLKKSGILIFKWNEDQILTSKILSLTDYKPLIGHISGKRAKTHFITFMK